MSPTSSKACGPHARSSCVACRLAQLGVDEVRLKALVGGQFQDHPLQPEVKP